MPRVIGIDPGTVSIDLCGLDDGALWLDRTLRTREALADPARLVAELEGMGPVDLVAGPSGYGLPLVPARAATDADLRLAFLAAGGEEGGIGGLRSLARALAASSLPVMFTPGAIHLTTVPAHRKANRVDLGTADKVCAAALAIAEQAARLGVAPDEASLVLLELGGAFTAALAVEGGRIVDGLGGSAGPMGARGAGALDGEVAYLAGTVEKGMLFRGGAADLAGAARPIEDALAGPDDERERAALDAYVEGGAKAVAALLVSVPRPREVVLSGRMARVERVRCGIARALRAVRDDLPVRALEGFARTAKAAAQGAALLADGLAGGRSAPLVAAMGLREAAGTALDHLRVITPERARRRLGLA
jgi:predicted butyrate kinase (DUF1464 family)